jgi:hypothetical protein
MSSNSNSPSLPVVLAVPVSTPSSEFQDLPEPIVAGTAVALAIPVSTYSEDYRKRWLCRVAALMEMLYFSVTIFMIQWSPFAACLGVATGLFGYLGSSTPVDLSRIRAIYAFRLLNSVLMIHQVMTFIVALSGLYSPSVKSVNYRGSASSPIDPEYAIGGVLNMVVCAICIIRSHAYHSEMTRHGY